MTFDDLLKACAGGEFPMVKVNRDICHAESNRGIVTVIKNNRNFKGCAVEFEGLDYDTWFYADNGTDKRKKYMNELELI